MEMEGKEGKEIDGEWNLGEEVCVIDFRGIDAPALNTNFYLVLCHKTTGLGLFYLVGLFVRF